MRPSFSALLAGAALIACGGIAPLSVAQPAPQAAPAPPPAAPLHSYSDMADLATAAPLALQVRLRKATRLKPERAPGLAPGMARFYVQGDVVSLIRGSVPLASRIAWLVDLPLGEGGKPPKLKAKAPLLIFARPIAGPTPGSTATDTVQLIAPDAQLPWTPADDALLRRILIAAVRADAPPAITGIASGFHVPGTLPGEGETQIFLETATGSPVSLTILRAPDGSRRWAAAFGEIVDESAAVPARGTLGWYRLACGLPASLPATALAGTEAEHIVLAQEDYAFVRGQLGACGRKRKPPPPPQR